MRRLLRMIFLSAALSVPLARAYDSATNPRLSTERIVLHTDLGDLALGLYPDLAPRHVAQVLKLVELGVYDNTQIFRIEPGFVAQVEHHEARVVPLTDQQKAAITRLPAELNSLPHVRGVLSMAHHDGDVDSAETSFSIILGNAAHLDGKYTIFGQVTGGWDTLAAIERVAVDENSRPKVPVMINHAEVVRDGKVPDEKPPIRFAPIAVTVILCGMLAWTLIPWRSKGHKAS